jgi:alpha-amylase/alpha-mannosidase (GH57 family)
MNEPLPVMMLWHLHQPFYRFPDEKQFRLPWVRLHTLREYHDMAEMLERFPGASVTVNWTPVLLQQIQEYTDGYGDRMQAYRDKQASELNPEEQYRFVRGAFRAHVATMIHPYPRLKELHKKWIDVKEKAAVKQQLKWEEEELFDLQVWSTLTWFGFSALKKYPELTELREKNSGFNENDKNTIREIEKNLLENCIPRWRQLLKETKTEVCVSPYFHPIGPLLCDYSDIDEAMPGVPKPERKIQWPEDARWQLREAKQAAKKWFDLDEVGLWPSEGSLSQNFIKEIADVGFKWTATDEALLHRALHENGGHNGDRDVYRAYSWQNRLPVFFRDHEISDRIGFDYSKMGTENALNDFFGYVESIRRRTPDRLNGRVLSIILDGENPWEYFHDAGESFLSGLYERLTHSDNLKAVTPSSFLEEEENNLPELKRMGAGSWINGDFNIWGGSSLDVRAWEMLAETREALHSWENLSDEECSQCWRALHTAQGSDWFWWYGEPFHSMDDEQFDEIFRRTLIYIYKQGGHPEPSHLYHPLQSSEKPSYDPPRLLVSPRIDGRESHYREWWGAAKIIPRRETGSMARVGERFKVIRFGSDTKNVYGKIEFETPPPDETRCEIKLNDNTYIFGPPSAGDGTISYADSNKEIEGSKWFFGETLEWQIPLAATDLSAGEYCRFKLQLVENGAPFERFPVHGALNLPILDKKSEASEWHV